MDTNDGGPAFPAQHFDLTPGERGISIRDYFAAKATEEDIRSMLRFGESYGDPCDRAVARFRHADEMLKAR